MIHISSQRIGKTKRERQRLQTTIFKTRGGIGRKDGMSKR